MSLNTGNFSLGFSTYDYILELGTNSSCHLAKAGNALNWSYAMLHPSRYDGYLLPDPLCQLLMHGDRFAD